MRLSFGRLLSLVLALLSVTPVLAELPAPVDNYLNDFSATLTASEQQQLQATAAKLEQETGVELTVVLIDRVASYQQDVSIERFARRLFDHWGSAIPSDRTASCCCWRVMIGRSGSNWSLAMGMIMTVPCSASSMTKCCHRSRTVNMVPACSPASRH